MAIIFAAVGGHIEIVNSMLRLGATNYDEIMIYAASGGHGEIVELMSFLGATQYNRAMIQAEINGIKISCIYYHHSYLEHKDQIKNNFPMIIGKLWHIEKI